MRYNYYPSYMQLMWLTVTYKINFLKYSKQFKLEIMHIFESYIFKEATFRKSIEPINLLGNGRVIRLTQQNPTAVC